MMLLRAIAAWMLVAIGSAACTVWLKCYDLANRVDGLTDEERARYFAAILKEKTEERAGR